MRTVFWLIDNNIIDYLEITWMFIIHICHYTGYTFLVGIFRQTSAKSNHVNFTHILSCSVILNCNMIGIKLLGFLTFVCIYTPSEDHRIPITLLPSTDVDMTYTDSRSTCTLAWARIRLCTGNVGYCYVKKKVHSSKISSN